MAKKADVRMRLETLFDTLCAESPVVRHCKNCGSEMVNHYVVIFFADGKRRWNVPLPICPKCDPEQYKKTTSNRAA